MTSPSPIEAGARAIHGEARWFKADGWERDLAYRQARGAAVAMVGALSNEAIDAVDTAAVHAGNEATNGLAFDLDDYNDGWRAELIKQLTEK